MLKWPSFFGTDELMPLAQAEAHYPNAKRHIVGSAFVSHAGTDAQKLDALLSNPLRERYGSYAVFQYSSRSPGKDDYRQIVRLALEYCRCAVVACSGASQGHPWVYAEVDWLLDHGRPVFVLRLDSTEIYTIHPGLADITLVPNERFFLSADVNNLIQRLDQFGIDGYPAFQDSTRS